MIRYAVSRIALGVVAVWLAASLAFVLVHLGPGGPAAVLAGESGAPGHLEEVSREFGLDRPLPTIYVDWLGRLVRGDLGVSYRAQVPVSTLIAERAPVTLALMVPALLLADDLLMRGADVVASLPTLVIAILVAALFGGSVAALIAVMGLTRWPLVGRLVRVEAASLRTREFVLAAHALGAPPFHVATRSAGARCSRGQGAAVHALANVRVS